MKNTPNLVWAIFFLLVVPLAGYTAYSGFVVGEMELPGGFRIVFREKPRGTTDDKIDDLSKAELEKRQAELDARFRKLEQQANQSSIPSKSQDINLSGTWYSQGGLSYQIVQSGNFVTIQEINPLYGVTAVGQGQIQGQTVLINYQTASYTQGIANLTISPEGRSLNGTFRDNYSGYTVPAILSR
jgi:hypothetical protein